MVHQHRPAAEVDLQRFGQAQQIGAILCAQPLSIIGSAEALHVLSVQHELVPVAVNRACTTRPQQRDHFAHSGAFAQHIAQEVNLRDAAAGKIGQHGFQRGQVAVYIGEKGGLSFHTGSPRLS